jgi:hypothetical protein
LARLGRTNARDGRFGAATVTFGISLTNFPPRAAGHWKWRRWHRIVHAVVACFMILALSWSAQIVRASVVDIRYGYYYDCSYLVHADIYDPPYGVYTYNHAPCAEYCTTFRGMVYNWGYYWNVLSNQWVSMSGGGWSCTGFRSTFSLTNDTDTVLSYGQIQRPPNSYSPMVIARASYLP